MIVHQSHEKDKLQNFGDNAMFIKKFQKRENHSSHIMYVDGMTIMNEELDGIKNIKDY